jgi:Metallo-peptidase family M12B Reprolysin-like
VSVRLLFALPPTVLPMSLLKRAKAPMQRRLNLNIICVGVELFTESDVVELQEAVEAVGDIYSQSGVDIRIGHVSYYGIPLAQADGHEDIDDHAEMEAVVSEWGWPGEAIDVFIVRSYAGATVGRSPVNGACDPGDAPDSGLIVSIEATAEITGKTMAHEIGHYLGLSAAHSSDKENLMFKFVDTGGTKLTPEQGAIVRKHCILYWTCRPE